MVGGDLYDAVMLDGQRLFFVIADVSGHGVPAALLMAMSMGVLRPATARQGEALDLVLAEANARIAAASNDLAADGGNMMFVTAFAAVLDLETGVVVYANAGHDAPFVLSEGAPPRHLTTEGGPPLGTVDGFPYTVGRHQLEAGDLVLLYTDGVTEAMDPTGALFTSERLQRVLAAAPKIGAKAIVDCVRDEIRGFAAEAEPADDITMLAVHWIGPAQNEG